MPKTTETNKSSALEKEDITVSSAEFEFEALPKAEIAVPDYTRRIQMLMAAIIIAVTAYSAGWFWFGSQLVKNTQATIAEAAFTGQNWSCLDPAAKGYPFRMGLSCAKTGLEIPSQGLKIEAGAFRSAAQVYEPERIIGELDGPLRVSSNLAVPVTINWALAHASVIGNGRLPERLSIEIKKPVLAETAAPELQSGAANLASFHMRQGDANRLDFATILESAKWKDAPVFEVSTDFSLSGTTRFIDALEKGMPLLETMRGNQGELRNAIFGFVDGGSVTFRGPFSIGESGLLSATLEMKAQNASELIDRLGELSVAFGAEPANLTALKAMAINDKIDLKINVKDGVASIGFITLGSIPPL